MKIIYEEAKKTSAKKIMLTVFKSNIQAVNFYTKLGFSICLISSYEPDETSPSRCTPNPQDYSYEIMSIKVE